MVQFLIHLVENNLSKPSLAKKQNRLGLTEGSSESQSAAGILILHLRNGSKKTLWGKRGFMLQECTVDAFENSANYCVFITCLAASLIFICIMVLGCFFEDLHTKYNNPWAFLLAQDWAGIIFDISADKGINQDRRLKHSEQELGCISAVCCRWLCEALMPSS